MLKMLAKIMKSCKLKLMLYQVNGHFISVLLVNDYL